VTVRTELIEFEMQWLFIQAAGALNQSKQEWVLRWFGI